MNEGFFDIIKKRRTIRRYKDKQVSKEIIIKIVDSARYAPSALNQQPWEFVIVEDLEKKKKIRKIYDEARHKLKLYGQDTSFVENATHIFVCADSKKVMAEMSVSLAMQNILLAATALNLGSTIMTAPVMLDESIKEIRDLLKIPENYKILALILIGYKDEEPMPREKRGLDDVLHFEGF